MRACAGQWTVVGHRLDGATEPGSGSWCEAYLWGPWLPGSPVPPALRVCCLEQIFSPVGPKNSGASARASGALPPEKKCSFALKLSHTARVTGVSNWAQGIN